MITVVALLVTGCQTAREMPEMSMVRPTEDPNRAFAIRSDPNLQRGQEIYDLRCAHCHGDNGEGQMPVTVPTAEALGLHIVPPQDSTGHTWMHPSQFLRQVILEGIVNPLYQFQMPPYEGVITEEEIDYVIAYMSLWWTEEQRAWQRHVTEYHEQLEAEYASRLDEAHDG